MAVRGRGLLDEHALDELRRESLREKGVVRSGERDGHGAHEDTSREAPPRSRESASAPGARATGGRPEGQTLATGMAGASTPSIFTATRPLPRNPSRFVTITSWRSSAPRAWPGGRNGPAHPWN